MSNVNCIRKNSTDYMYEDTAGRNLIGSAQDTSTTATKAYVVGDLFWLNNLLYRVTANIASGGTITVGTNCVETTVSDELANRATISALADKQNKTLDTALTVEGTSATTVEAALGALNDKKAGLTDLAPAFSASTTYAVRDCVTYNGGVYRFKNAHTGAWSDSDVDLITVTEAGGHDMIPIYDSDTGLTDLETIEALNSGTAEKVVNAYSVKRWSNCDAKVVLALASQGDDGIGDWEAEGTWETGSRSGWLWSTDLYHVLNDGATPPTTNYEVEVMPVFDGGEGETVSLYAFRIDDNVSNGGVNGGAVAFKFNAPIQSANGVRVGVKIINQRTDVTITGTTLT